MEINLKGRTFLIKKRSKVSFGKNLRKRFYLKYLQKVPHPPKLSRNVHYLCRSRTDPSLFVVVSVIDRCILAGSYALQKTRYSGGNNSTAGSVILAQSFVYYNGAKHYDNADTWFGLNVDNNWSGEAPGYMTFYPGGWNWPTAQAFENVLYPNANASGVYNGIPTLQSQVLSADLQRTIMFVLWNIHRHSLNSVTSSNQYLLNGVDISYLMKFGNNDGPGKLVLGPTYLDSCNHVDGLYRYIGPHKIETLRDTSNNHNHLSLDFGKSILFENNNHQLEILPRPGFNANLLIDGSGGSISINGVAITSSQWSYLVNTVLAGH